MSEVDDDFGLFGDMDIEDIPDDPWFVKAGTYLATVTKSEKIAKKDASGWGWVINYTIDEPESQYHGFTKGDWFNLYPGVAFADLNADQQRDVIQMKARIMEAFDRTEEEAKRFRPDDAMGEQVYLKVVERAGKGDHTGKTFSNISKVISKRKFEEENENPSASMNDAGFTGM